MTRVAEVIGRMISEARIAKGWRVIDLSLKTGIDARLILAFEEGRRKPNAGLAVQLNWALDIAIPVDSPALVTTVTPEIESRCELILDTIRTHVKVHYCTPTLREIAKAVNIGSTSMIESYIERLILAKQLVELETHKGARNRFQLPEVVNAIKGMEWN